MAIVTRVSGDAKGVVNVDRSRADLTEVDGVLVSFIGKHPTAFKLTAAASLTGEAGVEGKVQAALRAIQTQATVIAYQVDGVQLSVLVEAHGFADDAAVLAAVGADFTAVSSAAGFKLA